MPLYLGIPFTLLLLALGAWLRIGHFTFEWVVALLAGLWSAAQSRKYQLQRFERVFPLEPLALGVTVTLLFPVAFPWFLRLRHRALRGRLPLRTRPSRLRIALIVVALAGGLAFQLGYGFLRRLEPWKRIETSAADLDKVAGGPVSYQLVNDQLKLGVMNARLHAADPLVQRDTARAIARKGLAMAEGITRVVGSSIKSVEVRFIDPSSSPRSLRESPAYEFPATELR